MFGLSFQKIAVFVAIIGALFAAMRLIRGFERVRDQQAKNAQRPRDKAVVESMKECPTCRTYVLASAARDCGKPGCPYPT